MEEIDDEEEGGTKEGRGKQAQEQEQIGTEEADLEHQRRDEDVAGERQGVQAGTGRGC